MGALHGDADLSNVCGFPSCVSSGWTTDMAADLRKGRGQLWWREGAVATSLEPWFESELLFFKVLLT